MFEHHYSLKDALKVPHSYLYFIHVLGLGVDINFEKAEQDRIIVKIGEFFPFTKIYFYSKEEDAYHFQLDEKEVILKRISLFNFVINICKLFILINERMLKMNLEN